jgi:hypothetical protein
MVKNKWYERSHWTYKANRGWLIEKDISARKMECPMGNSQNFPSRPRGVSEEKTRQKPGEKKGAENYLLHTSDDVTSGDVISGDVASGDVISDDVTIPHTIPHKCALDST